MMHIRGNKRAGLAARSIIASALVLGLLTLAFGIYSISNEPAAVPGSQVIPGQAAEQAGALPRPTPRSR